MPESLEKWAKESKNRKYVIIIAIVLIACILITFFPSNNSPTEAVSTVVRQVTNETADDYETTLEKKLTNMLLKMEGVGSVSVMVTTVSNEEKVLAEDTTSNIQHTEEKDQAGGTRVSESSQVKSDIVLQNGNTPYVVKEYKPEIKGVFVLAQGADNSVVKNQIIDAVSKLLDVPVHKISVEKKSQ